MPRILVIDDHRLFLEGMCHLLKKLGDDFEVIESDSVQSAIDRIDGGERFTLALVDLAMPEMDGFSFLQALRERRIACPVVVVSASVDSGSIRKALRSGALGFIPKYASADEMLEGLIKVLNGDLFLPGDLWRQISDQPLNETENKPLPTHPSDETIGKRQLQVLELMNQGLANRKIAAILNISEATVKYHIGILFRALGVNSRTACIHEALKKKILNSETS